MKKIIKMLWITALVGFSINTFASNEDLGTVVGGIAGGLIGNNLGHGSGRAVATIGGAVIGSLVGNQIGSQADYNQGCYGPNCYRYSHWDSYQRPIYPPRYSNTFIRYDGRLCRRSMLMDDYGDRIYATFCCYRMSPNGYCTKWVSIN